MDLGAWRYVIVFLLMIVEGDVTLFTVAFLTSLGFFSPGLSIAAIYGGTIFGDVCWYLGGRWFASRDWWTVAFVNKLAAPFDGHITKRPLHVLFISKFTYTIHHALIFRAGALMNNKERLLKSDLIAVVMWMFVVGGLGYVSGASYSLVKQYLHYGEVALLIALICFFILSHFIAARSKKKL